LTFSTGPNFKTIIKKKRKKKKKLDQKAVVLASNHKKTRKKDRRFDRPEDHTREKGPSWATWPKQPTIKIKDKLSGQGKREKGRSRFEGQTIEVQP
jgi:hypothetical protein